MATAWGAPGRSLEQVTVYINDAGDLVLSCFCDCATTTDVVVDRENPPTTEFSYTCEGCLSVHWMAVWPLEGQHAPQQ